MRAPVHVSVDVIAGGDFPAGIKYGRWEQIVQPSPRERFADRLDVLELLDD